jgi:hypothetical protein
MMATRVVEYGYPKVHDGKNKIFAPDIPGSEIGYNKELDACTYITWGNYYFATIGVRLANLTDDIYKKTALIRLPYATVGLCGLVLFMFTLSLLFTDRNLYKWFLIIFLFIELFSITLVLHMRDARSYPLVIFICAAFFYMYVAKLMLDKLKYYIYALFMFFILTIAFHTNFMTFVILVMVYAAHQAFLFIREWQRSGKWNEFLKIMIPYFKNAAPVIAAGLVSLPFISFYELTKTSKAVSEYHHYTFDVYKDNLKTIWHYLSELEFLYTALVAKTIVAGLAYYATQQPVNKKNPFHSKFMPVSLFLLCFILVQVFMVARIPYYIFARYVVVVQILLVIMLVIDLFVIIEYVNRFFKMENVKRSLYFLFSLIIFVFIMNSRNKMEYVKGHMYELTHQYKGPLDYVIPYIKDNFKNTDSLIIATNYEEYSYMYYLNSKVIVGYPMNNLAEDAKCTPDIIMYRKTWGTDPKVFNDFIQKAQYQKVSFPVKDYPVNNIPELDFVIKHLFKTTFAANENEKTEILIRSAIMPQVKTSQ